MKQVLARIAALVFIGSVALCVVGAAGVFWATQRSMERTACYRSTASVEACGEPSLIEKAMAHYIAHVDL